MKDFVLYNSPVVQLLRNNQKGDDALYHNNVAYNIVDILDGAAKIANQLAKKGFVANDKAVIIAEPGIDFISTLYAIVMLKGVAAIIDPDMGNKLYLNRLQQFSPKWIFIDYRLSILQKHPILRQIYKWSREDAFYIPRIKGMQSVIMGKSLALLGQKLNITSMKKQSHPTIEWEEAKGSQNFLVTYTSGTLAMPKGVLHSDASMTNSLKLLAKKISKYHGHNMVSYLPHFALIGIQANVKVFLWKKEMETSKKIAFLNQHQINIFFGPPVEINELLEYCKANNVPFPVSMKYILLGSAPIYVPFLEKLQSFTDAEVECLYGMTENLLVGNIGSAEKMAYTGEGDIVGSPFEGVEVIIAEDDEILIRSNQLFEGYLDLPSTKVDGFHPTGDLGFLDEKGRIVLTGRKKNMIIRKEYNIYPGLYEPIINKIPGIEQGVMVGKYSHELADEEVYLVVETTEEMTKESIIKQLRSDKYSIDSSAMPDHIVFAKIPRKGRQQKIDYALLQKMI